MFSVKPVCRLLIVAWAVLMLMMLNFILNEKVMWVLSVIAIIWLWIYLAHLKIEITSGILVRNTGNIFKHKTIFLLKNIFYIQITTLTPWRPALVWLHGTTGTMLLLGLDGRQATMLEKEVKIYGGY